MGGRVQVGLETELLPELSRGHGNGVGCSLRGLSADRENRVTESLFRVLKFPPGGRA